MRASQTFLAAWVVTAMCWLCAAPAWSAGNPEMVVKAVMIRKFVEFVRWPEVVAPQKNKQVNVCVFGDSAMVQMEAVFAKTSPGNAVQFHLKSVASLDAASDCHVVFFSDSKQSQLTGAKGKPWLTVSDGDGFVEKGGMIGFRLIDGKVRYDINNRAFSTAGLGVDAQLLEIANKVVE